MNKIYQSNLITMVENKPIDYQQFNELQFLDTLNEQDKTQFTKD